MAAEDGDRPLKAERKPLSALVSVYPAGMTEAQWAVAAGLKRSGGTWSTYVSRLRMAGRIEERDGQFFATEQGIEDLGEAPPAMPPPGKPLVEFWCGKISGVGPMLRRLADVYPESLTKEQLGADVNLATSGGTFSTYVSRLRTAGLLVEGVDRRMSAAKALMEG